MHTDDHILASVASKRLKTADCEHIIFYFFAQVLQVIITIIRRNTRQRRNTRMKRAAEGVPHVQAQNPAWSETRESAGAPAERDGGRKTKTDEDALNPDPSVPPAPPLTLIREARRLRDPPPKKTSRNRRRWWRRWRPRRRRDPDVWPRKRPKRGRRGRRWAGVKSTWATPTLTTRLEITTCSAPSNGRRWEMFWRTEVKMCYCSDVWWEFCFGFHLLCVCVFLRLWRRRASATFQKKIWRREINTSRWKTAGSCKRCRTFDN